MEINKIRYWSIKIVIYLALFIDELNGEGSPRNGGSKIANVDGYLVENQSMLGHIHVGKWFAYGNKSVNSQ